MNRQFLKIRLVLFIFLALSTVALSAQNASATEGGDKKNPMFPGGNKALVEFLQKNLKYPESAKAAKAQAKIIVGFVIDKEGKINNVTVKQVNKIKSIITDDKTGQTKETVLPDKAYESLKKEAIRVVKAMPKWQPGMINGQPAQVDFNLPINFKL